VLSIYTPATPRTVPRRVSNSLSVFVCVFGSRFSFFSGSRRVFLGVVRRARNFGPSPMSAVPPFPPGLRKLLALSPNSVIVKPTPTIGKKMS